MFFKPPKLFLPKFILQIGFNYFPLVFKIKKMAVKQKIDVRDEIVDYLKEIERNLHWLHKKTEINYATLYSCFVQKTFNLSQDNLDLINEVLGTEFKLTA